MWVGFRWIDLRNLSSFLVTRTSSAGEADAVPHVHVSKSQMCHPHSEPTDWAAWNAAEPIHSVTSSTHDTSRT